MVQKAKGLTHEVAHIIGMRHDFTSSTFFIKRNRKCITTAPKWRGPSYFMEYKQAPWSWSTCSNEDFCRYFQKIEKNNGQFCLRPWFILNKMSLEFFENFFVVDFRPECHLCLIHQNDCGIFKEIFVEIPSGILLTNAASF